MAGINPTDGNTGDVSSTGSLNFQQQITTTKKYINCIYNMGQDGSGGGYNDPAQIDTRYEKNVLSDFLGQFKTWFNREKENLTQEQINEAEALIAEQEEVLENCITEDDQNWWGGNPAPTPTVHKLSPTEPEVISNTPLAESEWRTPEGPHAAGTVMRTVKKEDGSYYEEYKNPDTGRTYIAYDAEGNRTGASWNALINGVERPTRKEFVNPDGSVTAVNIEYDDSGNILKEYYD